MGDASCTITGIASRQLVTPLPANDLTYAGRQFTTNTPAHINLVFHGEQQQLERPANLMCTLRATAEKSSRVLQENSGRRRWVTTITLHVEHEP